MLYNKNKHIWHTKIVKRTIAITLNQRKTIFFFKWDFKSDLKDKTEFAALISSGKPFFRTSPEGLAAKALSDLLTN